MKQWKDLMPPVTQFLDPTLFLKSLYETAKLDDPSYSYLQFSEDMGLSRSNVLHLVIRGSRPLTPKAAQSIGEALGLKGLNRRYWLNMVLYHSSKDSSTRDEVMAEMQEIKSREISSSDSIQRQLEFFTEWYHSIIFEMASLPTFSDDPTVLAQSVEPKIRPEQARKSLALLEALGLLEKKEGKLVPSQGQITTPREIASLAIIRYHQNMIDLGKRSLTAIDAELRDVTSITFTCPSHLLPEVKDEISRFRKRMLLLADKKPDAEQVYQMNIQLFPTTKIKKAVKK